MEVGTPLFLLRPRGASVVVLFNNKLFPALQTSALLSNAPKQTVISPYASINISIICGISRTHKY